MSQQLPAYRNALDAAKNEFHRARMRGALAAVSARLNGKSIALLSFNDVAAKLKITGQATRGIETIPLHAIVGSVGRYNDFTRTFLPRNTADAERWASVRLAGPVANLPPIDVYKIGEVYFVLDGNHRVSIAMQHHLAYIDAHVVEVRTKVALSPDDDPVRLIIKSEYADFMERTGIDQLRPEADLLVSVPGQYETLENLIEVHRFFIEMAQGVELTDQEAVCRWYDEAYLPMVTAVRAQGILRYFPGRTETDFYVWLAKHQALLRNELGLELQPGVIVKLAAQFKPRPNRQNKGKPRQILETVTSGLGRRPAAGPRWSEQRLLDRYSQHLFLDVLVPLPDTAVPEHTWAPIITLAQREQAQILGLVLGQAPAVSESGEGLRRQCQLGGVTLQTAHETGDAVAAICRRAALVDLVILDSTFAWAQTRAILGQCPRPVLVLANHATHLDRVLLAYDGSPKANEALFIAAYLAEQWQVELVVVTAWESRRLPEAAEYAHRYLTMHEVTATFLETRGSAAPVIEQTAVAHHADLILLGGYKGRRRPGKTVERLVNWRERPLLICP